MLKIIPQNENDYEKAAKEELNIDSNFLDFFASEPKIVLDKINSTLSEIKSSKKGDLFYNKILYYFSFLISSIKNDDKGKKIIKNIIEICEPEVGIKIYQDLFYILTEDKNILPLKKEILCNINSSILKEENDFIILYNLFMLYLLKSNYDNDIISKLSELVDKNKNYILLKKLENIEELRKIISKEILNNKEVIAKDINISKLYFFLTMTSPDLVDEDLATITLNEKLINEKNLMDNLENRNDEEILFNSDKNKYFEDNYGIKAAELILIGAKENTIHEILIGFTDEDKKYNITIKEFIKRIFDDAEEEKEIKIKDEEIQSKFEEIEDMLISGNEHKLYNIIIDYSKKEIRILYIRRCKFEKEQKEEILKKVKDMKSRLEGILKAIQKI